ncbi:MAG: zinc ribbon domain-containing protein, partial [Clostridia bacterium]|nr:zinc ribbon domain-containing protein [Clostridia bacterium]
YKYGDEVFTNMYPQIVSDELFNLVQAKNKNNQYGSRSPYVVYLLHKKIICGYCGRTINGITGTSKSGNVKRYYACSGRYSGKKNCKKKSTRKEPLEDIVFQAIMQVFQDEKFVGKIADKIIETNEKRFNDQSILNLLKQEQDKIIKAKNNILSAIEMGIITSSTKERLQELEKKEEEMTEKILLEQSKERMTIDRNDIIRFIKKALNNKAERIIDLLVKQIVLYDDKIEIKCNYTQHKNDTELNLPIYNKNVELPMTADKDFIINMQDVNLVIKV